MTTPTSERPPSLSTRTVVAVFVALALLVGGTVVVAFKQLGGDDSGGKTTPGHTRHISFPNHWDARILPLVRYVQRHRHLTFKHPVAIDYLTPAEFRKKVTTSESDLSAKDKEDVKNAESLFRALGLLQSGVDLFKKSNDLSGAGVLGLYDFDDKRIRVRGRTLTPGLRVTLVHELTHVLQDQYFGIDNIDDLPTSGESTALRAVVEGDAVRIQTMYEKTLSPSDRRQADRQNAGDPNALKGIPKILVSMFAEPYALGGAFLAMVQAHDGVEGIDEALRHPPTTEENLIDPSTYYAGEDPLSVPAIHLRPGEKSLGKDLSGDVGALSWYLVLAQRLDPRVALHAVDGWGGDTSTTFRRNGRVCFEAHIKGDRTSDTTRMAQALKTWVKQSPRSAAASVAAQRGYVTFESCDPGARTRPPHVHGELLTLPAGRDYLDAGLTKAGLDDDVVRCAANRVIEHGPLDGLLHPSRFIPTPAGQALIRDSVAHCGGF